MRDVLIVDDDFMVAEIHRRFVEQVDGFRAVGVARTGTEALAAVRDMKPHLMLLDVYLPDMTGLEVLQRLRSDGDLVGVIMITAARELDTVKGALDGGAADYLIKPFEFPQFKSKLEAFAARATPWSPPVGSTKRWSTRCSAGRAARRRHSPRDSAPRPGNWCSMRYAGSARYPQPNALIWLGSRGSARAVISSTTCALERWSFGCSTAPAGPSVATTYAAASVHATVNSEGVAPSQPAFDVPPLEGWRWVRVGLCTLLIVLCA